MEQLIRKEGGRRQKQKTGINDNKFFIYYSVELNELCFLCLVHLPVGIRTVLPRANKKTNAAFAVLEAGTTFSLCYVMSRRLKLGGNEGTLGRRETTVLVF